MRPMEPFLKQVAEAVALACELAAIAFVALGALEAFARTALQFRRYGDLQLKKEIWVRFAASILLALEFALAADIARTAIAPTWEDIGKLAAIAAIRTALNWFLEKDVEAFRAESAESAPR